MASNIKIISKSLLSWFENRRKSKTLGLAQNQIVKSINTVSELEKALIAFSNKNKLEAKQAIERLFLEEVEIDELRRAIFADLIKERLPPKFCEDLKDLVKRLDMMADFVKDAARSVIILIDSESKIPKEILDRIVDMVKTLVECTTYLSTSIEMLGVSSSQANEFAQKVDEAEGRVDEYYLRSKIVFFEHTEEVNAPIFMEINDLIESIEQAADMCADTADFIRVLALGES